ncbi:MAG: 8-amino-7-oxononanoate synthase [Mycobacteriales bacterium]
MTTFVEWLRAGIDSRAREGLLRRLKPRTAGSKAVDLAGNDYLGLAADPRVVAAAVSAAREWGAGATASRLVTGTTALHDELEEALADFCGQPAALVFSSGYLANLGVVTSLGGPDALIVSDAHNHASLIDGCRLSRSRVAVVPHGDVAAVDAALAGRAEARALVLTESIFSALGDAAPLAELAAVCARRDAVLVVDEAHGVGVTGGGRGSVAAAGLAGAPHVVVTATLSKALGSQGGVVLGPAELREYLINRARTFFFDTGLAPAAAGAALAAVRIAAAEPDRVAQIATTGALLAGVVGVPAPAAAVLAVPMPGPVQAVEAAARCADEGVLIGCFRPPSAPDGTSQLRVTARAGLEPDQLSRAVEVLEMVVRRG